MELISSLKPDDEVIYHRATVVEVAPSSVTAEMEDDFHHFRVTLKHDGEVATEVLGESIRFPWSTCGQEAQQHIGELVGCRLSTLYKQLSVEERYTHCTHLFDLAQLAVSHAGDAESRLLYQSKVTLLPSRGPIAAELRLNGDRLLDWQLDNRMITAPAPFAGTPVDTLAGWVYKQQFSAQLIEAILILQRAVHVSFGKIYEWQSLSWASEQKLPPTCYTFQPGTAQRAARVVGSARDYTKTPEQMLGGKNR